jgi:hypothetical protein
LTSFLVKPSCTHIHERSSHVSSQFINYLQDMAAHLSSVQDENCLTITETWSRLQEGISLSLFQYFILQSAHKNPSHYCQENLCFSRVRAWEIQLRVRVEEIIITEKLYIQHRENEASDQINLIEYVVTAVWHMCAVCCVGARESPKT